MLSDYATRSDGYVFNGNALNELFGKLVASTSTTSTTATTATLAEAKSAVNNSTSVVQSASTAGSTDLTIDSTGKSTQIKSLNFGDMKTNLGGAPITLRFGGYDWTVVYATTNTTTGDPYTNNATYSGDLVVTLWMNDNLPTGSKKSAYVDTAVAVTYPSNMYSTNYIRVATLNAGGDNGEYAAGTGGTTTFATSTSSRGGNNGTVTLAERKNNEFANFTLSNSVIGSTGNNPSFTQFLTAPKNVAYQEKENYPWANVSVSNDVFLLQNEAWGTPDVTIKNVNNGTKVGVGGWYNDNFKNYQIKPAYYEWSNDYLWLPSLTETGLYVNSSYSVRGLWGISTINGADDILKSTQPKDTFAYSWSRSADYNTANGSATLTTNGELKWAVTTYGYTLQSACGVRPALHLNLSKAWESAAIALEVPSDPVEKDYNGEAQYFKNDPADDPETNDAWYDPSIFEDINYGTVTYTDPDTNNPAIPKDVGTYKVTFEIKSTKYSWKGAANTVRKKEVTLVIKKKTLSVEFRIDTTTQMPTLALAPGESPFSIDNASPGDFELLIHYYTTDGVDKGTDPSVLTKGERYQAYAEFGGTRGGNYQPDYTSPLTFTNPATRVGASFTPATQTYNGTVRNFTLILTGGATATATLKDGYDSDVKKVTDTRFSAINAGVYEVTLSLNNKDDYVWASTGRTEDIKVYFEVTPLVKQVSVVNYSTSWSVTEGYTTTATFEIPPLDSGTLRVIVGAYYMDTLFDNLCAIDLSTATTHHETLTLETGSLPANLTYELGIDYDDPTEVNARNYKVEFVQTYSITVKEPSLTGGVNWRLMADGAVIGNQSDSADTNSITYGSKITYSGKNYSFTINASGIGYNVDTDYNDNGFVNGYKTVKASAPTVALSSAAVKDAGTYITYVHLTNSEGSAEYSIQFTIDKAKYDLSGVRWLPNDGQIQFSGKMSIVIDPDTLPEGLSVKQYDGSHSATQITDEGTAGVIFKVDDSNNYVVPVSTNPTSYIFTPNGGLDDFEWEKDWEVVPAEIPVVWTVGTVSANGNKKVNAKVLEGNYDAYLDYVYYESDGKGVVAEGATPITKLDVIEGTVKYYVTEVSVKPNFEGSYALATGNTSERSGVFEVGHTLTAILLAAKKTTYSYWGGAVEFQYRVTQGTITNDAFEITYYKGTLRQVNTPKDVGNYTALISLKSEFANDYYIDGITSFDYKIERAVIAVNWNEGTKPPVLKITQDQKACISYEYIDGAGNSVSLSGMRNGAYKVRAVIKSASMKNYIFDNQLTYTDWVEFTVTPSDSLIDPEDSTLYGPSSNPNAGPTEVTIWQIGSTSGFSNSENLNPNVYFNVSYYSLTDGRYLEAGEEPNVAGNRYQVVVTIKDEYADRYVINPNGSRFTFTVSDGAENPPAKDPDGTGGNPSNGTIISYLPLILSGISIILIVVFVIVTMNNLSAAKAARAKTKKLAAMSYSFAPAGLLAMVFGLSETNWWIIAGVLMGLALISAIAAFMSKGKKKRALEALEEEQERVAEEKEYARREEMREEQNRRDNEMKMMFAAMQQQGGYAQQPMYDDSHIQNLIASTVSALLPAMQQQMALPPAQDPSMYAPQPDYAARAENEELRAQLAKQQELLNQLLQNQQAQQAAYEYEEEPVDDISWLGESEEVVSLEESYGNLNDEGKRFYYEIGSYIMNKPRTSQNDGRYAVLFKYRGRTVFKLAIKDDAPVLYYPAGSDRSEVRVSDTSSLDTAKSIIDHTVMNVDSQM